MTGEYAPYNYETAGIASINPLLPHSWGIFISGGHPQTPAGSILHLFFSGLITIGYHTFIRTRLDYVLNDLTAILCAAIMTRRYADRFDLWRVLK
jgi:hypothetical protein